MKVLKVLIVEGAKNSRLDPECHHLFAKAVKASLEVREGVEATITKWSEEVLPEKADAIVFLHETMEREAEAVAATDQPARVFLLTASPRWEWPGSEKVVWADQIETAQPEKLQKLILGLGHCLFSPFF